MLHPNTPTGSVRKQQYDNGPGATVDDFGGSGLRGRRESGQPAAGQYFASPAPSASGNLADMEGGSTPGYDEPYAGSKNATSA